MTEQIPILQVRDLVVQLQSEKECWNVVDHLNFNLYSGQTLALVGESGCGKSMTAHSILRILPSPPALPPQGEILYQNQNLIHLSEKEMRKIRGSKIAMIFQDPMSALNPVYTIGDQLMEVADFHLNLTSDEAWEQAKTVLQAVGISDPESRLHAYPHQLSGGLKQRVMIAMALMCEPDILIADEPTTALDVTVQSQVLSLIRHLQEKNGMALLLITHDMGVVAEMADEVIVMYTAQSVEKGHVEDIFYHKAHPYTLGLFESKPSLQGQQGKLKPIPGQVPSSKHLPKGCRFHPRCPFAMQKCYHGTVPYFHLSDEHVTKCWLYDGSQESRDKLKNSQLEQTW
jgi:peptide/nickel transport system ATP-binding protein